MAIWPTRLHSLTAAGRGSGGRESISPGEGDGVGSNSLPRTIRIAVWEIFSGSPRGLGSFSGVFAIGEIFSGVSALLENNFGPKNSDSSRESAAAPPVRDPPKFFSPTALFLREFFSKYSRAPAQKRKKCEKIHSHSHNKIIVPLIV